MPPIPATLPALPQNPLEAPAFIATAMGSRFSDALMALLAPESAPTISSDDARALGWRELFRPATGGVELELATPRAEATPGEEETPSIEDFASLGLPGLVMPFTLAPAPTAAAARLDDAIEPATLAATGNTSTLDKPAAELRAEAPTREALPVEFAEVQRVATETVEAVPAKLAMDAPVGSSGFRDQTADAMRWMVRHGETHAEIRIEPPDLGPIQIELKIAREGTEVVFVAAHPDTRDALQDQLPELRDLLAESGIHLSEASVRDESEAQGRFDAQATDSTDDSDGSAPLAAPLPASDRLIDTFA